MPGRLEPEPVPRRDFLGLAAIGSAVSAFVFAALGALRLPMPAVFPESNPRVKIGPPEAYPPGSATHLNDLGIWVHHDDKGLYAISSVCTHLGCITKREKSGSFRCPCHGSVFDEEGRVVAGPAPKRLDRLALSLSPDGQVLVDMRQTVRPGARLQA